MGLTIPIIFVYEYTSSASISRRSNTRRTSIDEIISRGGRTSADWKMYRGGKMSGCKTSAGEPWWGGERQLEDMLWREDKRWDSGARREDELRLEDKRQVEDVSQREDERREDKVHQ